MVNCSNCGFDAGDSKFCPNCGSEMVIESPANICPNCESDVGESNFCPNCGTKIEKESPKSFCPNCGEDVGNSAFCPNCGTKMGGGQQENLCPNCGKQLSNSSKFCPYCGWSENKKDQDSTSDKIGKSESSFSGRLANKLNKNKTVNNIFDKTGSLAYKNYKKNVHSSNNRKLFEKTEPVFLEVFDSIEDDFIKAIMLLEREKHNSVDGWGIIGAVATVVNTPTYGMPHDDAVQFYLDIATRIESEINHEKNSGNFDEEEFYTRKLKESSLSKLSF